MTTTLTTRSTIHSIRFAVASRIASNYFVQNGGISLGLMSDYLREPAEGPSRNALNDVMEALAVRLSQTAYAMDTASVNVESGAPPEYRDIFRGATKQEMDALYEPTLHFLEVTQGPLECDAPNHVCGPKRWGYAGDVLDVAAAPSGCEETINLWTRRARALHQGHPDQRYWNKGRAPYTFWRHANFDPNNRTKH